MEDMIINDRTGADKKLLVGVDLTAARGWVPRISISNPIHKVATVDLKWRDLAEILRVLRGELLSSKSNNVLTEHVVDCQAYRISLDSDHWIEIDSCSAIALDLVIKRLIVSDALDVEP